MSYWHAPPANVLALVTDRLPIDIAVAAAVVAPLVLLRVIPRGLSWSIFVAGVSAALGLACLHLLPYYGGLAKLTAHVTAGLSLLWSLCAALAGRSGTRPAPDEPSHASCFASVCRVAAMTGGLAAVVILMTMAAILGGYWALAVANSAALAPSRGLGFGPGGLLTLGMVAAACLVSLGSTGDRRLATALFWLAALSGAWAALLTLPAEGFLAGTVTRTAGPLVLMMLWSAAIACFVAVGFAMGIRRRWRAACFAPDDLLKPAEPWPGFRTSVGALAILLALVVCYYLAVPTDPATLSFRLSAALAGACAASAGVAVFALLGQRWSVNLADAGMGLVTLAVVAWSLVLLPSEPAVLNRRYPLIFNAAMIALSVMAFVWMWLGGVWAQQRAPEGAWTAAGRLAPLCSRMAAFAGLLALLVGSLMALWPMLRPIPGGDDSLSRVTWSVSAHLFLLLVLLWTGRRTRRSTFRVLAALTVLSLAGFVAVRSGPRSSHVLHGPSVQQRFLANPQKGAA